MPSGAPVLTDRTLYRTRKMSTFSPLQALGRGFRRIARAYVDWRTEQATRIALAGLDERALRDIGIDRHGTPLRYVAPAETNANTNDKLRAAA